LGNRAALQPAKKRPVYVNGVYCESLAAAAKQASKVLGRAVHVWEIHRAANGKIVIAGLTIGEKKLCAKLTIGEKTSRVSG
jgi:hypothetical protein